MAVSRIKGIGIDLVDINRIAQVVNRQPRFPERVLTAIELKKYRSKKTDKNKLQFLAGRFAAKEAFSKAYGTGIGKELSFQDLTIENLPEGQPIVTSSPFDGYIHISISHIDSKATAFVILEEK